MITPSSRVARICLRFGGSGRADGFEALAVVDASDEHPTANATKPRMMMKADFMGLTARGIGGPRSGPSAEAIGSSLPPTRIRPETVVLLQFPPWLR